MTSDSNGTYRGVYTYGLERIAERDLAAVEGVPNDPLYYLYDGRGSVSQLVNTENHVRDKYRYTPFGVPMPGGQLTPNTRLFNNPYGYNGEDYDIESGLQFLRARYYNPETARFISRDSYLGDVMEPLSLNRYAYTSNNPLMYKDPSGHKYESQDIGNKYVEQSNNLYLKAKGQSTPKQPTLEKYSKDTSSTEVLQSMLRDLGYYIGPSGVDGDYGNYTKDAVEDFQRDNNLQVDGIAGPKTWDKLQKKHTDYENVESVREAEKRDYAAKKALEAKVRSESDVACGDKGDISSGTQGTSKDETIDIMYLGKVPISDIGKYGFKSVEEVKAANEAEMQILRQQANALYDQYEHEYREQANKQIMIGLNVAILGFGLTLPKGNFNGFNLNKRGSDAGLKPINKGTGKGIPLSEYDDIYGNSIHNAYSNEVILGKFEYPNSPTNYISKAKDSGMTYFDLGEDWGIIKNKYKFTDDDMFKLFNEPFLDDGINYGKRFNFSHDPEVYGGALNMELEYLLENGYKYINNGGSMYAIPK